ncbi:hypothetical protein E2C01_046637 [Portunus trituberculatus]|uniref:Uncharacterized protein n=1 Tax=Portunus trituberculatus TaxID=210409 RepID=A0A5B7FZ38_PORTR|nr:hypothetical protein [Portunus trituberculatus]
MLPPAIITPFTCVIPDSLNCTLQHAPDGLQVTVHSSNTPPAFLSLSMFSLKVKSPDLLRMYQLSGLPRASSLFPRLASPPHKPGSVAPIPTLPKMTKQRHLPRVVFRHEASPPPTVPPRRPASPCSLPSQPVCFTLLLFAVFTVHSTLSCVYP